METTRKGEKVMIYTDPTTKYWFEGEATLLEIIQAMPGIEYWLVLFESEMRIEQRFISL